jgi:hypothetical protein
MKTYKYSTKERAERVAKSLGCSGSHYHNEDGERKYMPCKDMKTFKEKTKKETKGKETEVTELVDDDGTWLSDATPILDPSSAGMKNNPSITDKIVHQARMPRDPLLRGWYGYYGESEIKEEDMEKAFGFEDTMFMDYDDTVKHYQKKLGLDKNNAVDRAVQQGKKPNLHKKTPKKIRKKKNYIDRLILKEKDIDESENLGEDILLDKGDKMNGELNDNSQNINPILLRNINSLKKMAKSQGISTKELINLFRNEF